MSKTIRLIYPQWQGGVISQWIPELSEEDSSRGYFLGAQLLNMLASKNASQETFEVPISMDISKREIKNGMMDYDFILNQSKEALKILEENNPDKIIVFGGECSVSVIPFTFLNKKYNNDIAIIWIDAHPDITLPNDSYSGYHAMALTQEVFEVIDLVNKDMAFNGLKFNSYQSKVWNRLKEQAYRSYAKDRNALGFSGAFGVSS